MEITNYVRNGPHYVGRSTKDFKGTHIAQRHEVKAPLEISYRDSRIGKNGPVEEGRRQSDSIGTYGRNEVRTWHQVLGVGQACGKPDEQSH